MLSPWVVCLCFVDVRVVGSGGFHGKEAEMAAVRSDWPALPPQNSYAHPTDRLQSKHSEPAHFHVTKHPCLLSSSPSLASQPPARGGCMFMVSVTLNRGRRAEVRTTLRSVSSAATVLGRRRLGEALVAAHPLSHKQVTPSSPNESCRVIFCRVSDCVL